MAKIGFLGLGAMGLPMAKRLAAAGHELTITIHHNPAPARELEALGARIVSGSAQAVAETDFVVSMLPADKQIKEALLDQAVMAAMAPQTIILEMSTARARTVRELAAAYSARQVFVLDAPVSGGVKGAQEGSLTIMCGGDSAILEKARPVLAAMGSKIFLAGELGAGKRLKAVNNMLSAANTLMVAEALTLARKLGLDLDMAYEVIKTSSGRSFDFDARFLRMAREDFAGGFKLKLMIKDLGIALSEAEDLALPMSSLAHQLYKMTDPADRDLDFGAVARILPRQG